MQEWLNRRGDVRKSPPLVRPLVGLLVQGISVLPDDGDRVSPRNVVFFQISEKTSSNHIAAKVSNLLTQFLRTSS